MILVALLGFLAGLGYTIDLGAGPVLFICFLGLVVYRCRSVKAAMIFLLAALPWLALHHAVNYWVGGTFQPANAVHEYLMWSGSPFDAANITGIWNHPSFLRFLRYALDLPFGKRGFLGHNLPLFLAVVGLVHLLRRRPAELPEVICAGCGAAGVWLIYAAGSSNCSGLCCSVRWLVPLLAPGYFILAVLLRDHREYRADFYFLSSWGALLAAVMCGKGPWARHMVPGYWFFYAAALLTWGVFHVRRLIAASPGRKYHQDGVDVPIGHAEEPGDAPLLGGFTALASLRRAGPLAGPADGRTGSSDHYSRQGHPALPDPQEAA